jgi:hypothetical protein
MHVDGGCYCGSIRFEAEVEPKRVGIYFHLLEGSPAVYEKTAESGAPRALAFCARCGTHVWGTSDGEGPRFYSVRVGVLAQRAELPPVAQVWCRSAMPWLSNLAGVRRIETQ